MDGAKSFAPIMHEVYPPQPGEHAVLAHDNYTGAVKKMRTFVSGTVLGLAVALGAVACAGDHTPPSDTETEAPTSPPNAQPEPSAEPGEQSSEQPTAAPEPSEPAFDRGAHSIDDPMSIWVVLNKQRPMNPVDFEPTDLITPAGVPNEFAQDLREPAALALIDLYDAATDAGIDLRVNSAYRPYSLQVALYGSYVARDGALLADTYSARPGHSEHQTGLTVDFDDWGECYLQHCFEATEAGLWLAEHAHEFGFIMRYPDGFTHITGFTYEPWHYRFVGAPLAIEMRETGVRTLEEFFGLGHAPDYAQGTVDGADSSDAANSFEAPAGE